MGQKVHSVGLRLGVNKKWKSSWFCDYLNYSKFLHVNLNINKFLKSFLLLHPQKSLLIDSKIIKSSNNKLYIVVFFYKMRNEKNNQKLKKNYNKSRYLNFFNTKKFYNNKQVEQKYLNKNKSKNLKSNKVITNNFDSKSFNKLFFNKKSLTNYSYKYNILVKNNEIFNYLNFLKWRIKIYTNNIKHSKNFILVQNNYKKWLLYYKLFYIYKTLYNIDNKKIYNIKKNVSKKKFTKNNFVNYYILKHFYNNKNISNFKKSIYYKQIRPVLLLKLKNKTFKNNKIILNNKLKINFFNTNLLWKLKNKQKSIKIKKIKFNKLYNFYINKQKYGKKRLFNLPNNKLKHFLTYNKYNKVYYNHYNKNYNGNNLSENELLTKSLHFKNNFNKFLSFFHNVLYKIYKQKFLNNLQNNIKNVNNKNIDLLKKIIAYKLTIYNTKTIINIINKNIKNFTNLLFLNWKNIVINYLYFSHFNKYYYVQHFFNNNNWLQQKQKKLFFLKNINAKNDNKNLQLLKTNFKWKLFFFQKIKKNIVKTHSLIKKWENFYIKTLKNKKSLNYFKKSLYFYNFKHFFLHLLINELSNKEKKEFKQNKEFNNNLKHILAYFFKKINNTKPSTSRFNKNFVIQLKQDKKLLKIKEQRFFKYINKYLKNNIKNNSLILKDYLYFINKKKSFNYKLTLQPHLSNYNYLKKILNIITKCNIDIIFINSLSLTKFSFQYQNPNLSKQKQLEKINRHYNSLKQFEKNIMWRWKRIQFLGKNLVHIIFISLFMKNAQCLASFISYTLTFLPKNKRQTTFLKFLSTIILSLKGEFKDIKGLRLQFKGRFNRWKRSKKWTINSGTLLLQTYDTELTYGFKKGLVSKGTFSTRIWIQYDKSFNNSYLKCIESYFKYSKIKSKLKKL